MNPETISDIRLTQYSHGAGCGCKIAPSVLDKILHSSLPQPNYDNLLVGNGSRDDAAVYRLPGQAGQCVISTTDFFMPIVDDPFDFGRIASANAISDVYAMGGRPLLAIAVLGWPIDKLSPEVAALVTEGARAICAKAGIPLAGGHSIDSPEPIFGLAVTGLVDEKDLKRNDTATAGCRLYLTKPLGVGILTTAQKRGILRPEDADVAPAQMRQLNKIGADLGQLAGVKAMTDVTGFGLLGHLAEVCEGSGVQGVIAYDRVPRIAAAAHYLQQGAVPGGTVRNFQSYGHKIAALTDEQKSYLCDPQTSGGLLVCVEPGADEAAAQALFAQHGLVLESFGELRPHTAGQPWIVVE
jgi:selenide,water dikinase